MKIAVVGMGVEGRSVVDYFAKQKGCVTTTRDKKAGADYLKGLEEFDLVFRSPGVPALTKEFEKVRPKMTSATRYFFEHCPAEIIGVTGTKGKGTTCTLLSEMLKESHKTYLGGNIGTSPLSFLDKVGPDDSVVLELSSFQLQDLTQSPEIAVVLSITEDHLDHHKTMEEYVAAKKSIVRFQGADDVAVIDVDNEISASFKKATKAHVREVSIEKSVREGGFLKKSELVLKHAGKEAVIGRIGEVGLIGRHNLKNILMAAVAAQASGASLETIRDVVKNCKGLPHRLEHVADIDEVSFYNDSASTNPSTTVAALHAFDRPLVLIAGGSDKNLDMTPLAQAVAATPTIRAVVLMGETQNAIIAAIEVAMKKPAPGRTHELELITAETYAEGFMAARLLAESGDVVLLSPGCASFDMFANYAERGEIFKRFVLDQSVREQNS